MPDDIERSRGRPSNYKFDRGNTPAESGPFVGKVKNNIDPTRSGRLQVYIEQFAGPDEQDPSLWRTVSYIPPFYGVTPHTGTNQGAGTFTGNQQSYGMWFTPPDLGVYVICFFVTGDPNQGYYIGCIPDIGISHMIPAIGASTNYNLSNGPQDSYFSGATQLPVTEINDRNLEIAENPRFFDQVKPVHSYVAGVMMQQGLIRDTVRGPITSNSQRETPSSAFGLTTPGRAIYQGGLNEKDIRAQVDTGVLLPQDVEVIARRGGHSIVLDDGDLEGRDNLTRIRTAKGHQITMSDDGDCFYIIHANGQTWLEFGKQGTVDVFSTNSVNIRTQGTINLHADKDINMYAGGSINAKSKIIKQEAESDFAVIGTGKLTLYSKNLVGVKSDGALNLKAASGSWDGGSSLSLVAGCINLNGGGAASVETPVALKDLTLSDTVFKPNIGWTVESGKLKTIVTRAPTHEPYPYHNQGVNASANLNPATDDALGEQSALALEGIADVSVENGIDTADLLNEIPAEIPVGNLGNDQVTALLAQTSVDVDQAADQVSVEKGIGRYGLSPNQLEAAGYLKPGTVSSFLQNPADLESVLSSPAVWTGKSDISNLNSLLADPGLQSLTQNEIMVASLEGLRQAGVVTGGESAANLAPFVQVASKFGVNNTVDWVKGLAPANIVNQINSSAKSAQYAVDLLAKQAPALPGLPVSLGGFVGTTQRSAVDDAVVDIIGDPKIPSPIYSDELDDIAEAEEFVEEFTQTETVTESGGTETVIRRTADTRTAEPTPEVLLRDLQNQIASVQATIRFRVRRGLDTSTQDIELAELERQLNDLKMGV